MTEYGDQQKGQDERSILIIFVLDKSGSMGCIREATVAGFNQFLREQQQEGGSAAMTLTLFDTYFQTVTRALPLAEVRPLDYRSYVPGGATALYDAIAHTMTITDEYVAAHKPDQVLFVIMTDGQENSSREFDRCRIMEMIEDRQRSADYEFIYLGANQDAYAVGSGIGIHGSRSLQYCASPDAMRTTMDRVSLNVKAHRRLGSSRRGDEEFFSLAMEDVGRGSYEEHKTKRDAAAGAASAAGGTTPSAPHRGAKNAADRTAKSPSGPARDKQEG